ncbi:MAG: 50S ribosomal protein L10 [Firmicutes bacterium]|nr:50S ribosomal protein L10 [Bacillota bacterium]
MASPIILKQKQEEVAQTLEKIQKAKSVILVDYRGLSVAQDTQMRVEMRKEGVEYKVIKNRIMLRALRDAGFTNEFDEILTGPTAVAFGYEDAVVPAKILADSVKKFNKMKLKGGVAEGKFLPEAEVVALSKIPPKPVLVAQLLGLLTSPMRSLAIGLSEVAKKKA